MKETNAQVTNQRYLTNIGLTTERQKNLEVISGMGDEIERLETELLMKDDELQRLKRDFEKMIEIKNIIIN